MPASVPHRPRAEQAPQAAASPSVLRADRVHDGERLGGPGWIALAEGRVVAVGTAVSYTHLRAHETLS